MNKTIMALALFGIFIPLSFAGELVISVKGHQALTLKKVSKKRYEKISSITTGVESVDYISEKGTKNLRKQEINIPDEGKKFAFEVMAKNIVKVEDEKENINTMVEADVDMTILGNVKSIKIDSETIMNLYADSIKKSGIDILKDLNIGNGTIQSKIDTSDLNCIADGDLLRCEEEQDFKFQLSVGLLE